MRQYLDLMGHVLEHGHRKDDRTGTGTLSVFGHQMRFDLGQGFPLVTTKRLHLRSIIHELLWFIRGETNVQYLRDNGVTIWDEWADAAGELGPVYGAQWRSWPARDGSTIDQLGDVIARIRKNPDSRRLIVTAWNPADVDRTTRDRAKAVMTHLEQKFKDEDLKNQVGLLWLGEEYAQMGDEFCGWNRSRAGACSATDINRSAFVAWIDCAI